MGDSLHDYISSPGPDRYGLFPEHSHSSIKAAAAGMDEASDHCVKDKSQDLKEGNTRISTNE